MSDEVDYTPVTPPGAEQPAQTISTVDSDALLNELPKGSPERKAVFGESEPDTPLSIEEAAARLRERRTKDADLVRYSDEARPRTDKQAAQDLTLTKRAQRAANISRDFPGVGSPVEQAIEIERGGRIHAYPLGDEKVPPLSHGDTVEQATERLTKMREQRINEIQQIMAQQLPPEALAEATPPVEAQQQPQQPEPQPPPVVDPIESERVRVRAEAEALSQMRNMSAQENRLIFQAQQLDTLLTQKYGQRVAQAGGFDNFAKADPAAASEILQAKSSYDALTGQAQSYGQLRQANEQMLQHSREAEQVRVNVAERAKADAEFEKFVNQADPQWQDASYRANLQKMALTLIEEIAPGSSEAIRRGQVFVTAAQQRGLYDIARARLGDERIKQSMETGRQKAMDNLPKVMRPGNGETRAEAAAHDFGAQLNALPGMSPTDAAKAGAKLLAARRSATRHAR
jgi:hypothetical protein